MFNQNSARNRSNLGQIIPGYGYYDRMGDSLAENLLNLVEAMLSLVAFLRR